jgi:hypothetical protein
VDIGVAKATAPIQEFHVIHCAHDPSPLEDLPNITPADARTGGAYGINAYKNPALGYLAMKDLLGNDMFRTCLHA